MKKINFLLIALTISACTPQVTATPEVTVTLAPPTPIPTPTLQPEFVIEQEKIGEIENFELTNDGMIEHNGETVPNITVTADGNYVLVVGNDMILLEPNQVTFDPEKGVVPDGYELENGEWVEIESISETEQQMYTDFDKFNQNLKQDIADGKYGLETDAEGNVTLTDAEGNIVYKNGSYEPLFLGQLIVENNMCKQTEWTGTRIGHTSPSNLSEYKDQYGQPVVDAYNLYIKNKVIKSSGNWGSDYYLGDGCWAKVFFRLSGYTEAQSDAWYLWKDDKGRTQYRQIFFTPEM